ncbi:MAG: hypothetical protein KF764_02500 [Labilithrix sp.]|nr:hypothetical protein [Labilithrix sp.]
MWSRGWLAALLLVVSPRGAEAAEVPIPGNERAVEVHGFVSPGFIVTTSNNYLAKSRRGSFEFTEVGINFTVPITDKLRSGVQLFARDLGPTDNYTPRADWFYLDYRFEDWLGFRAGRVKIPFGLYNDSSDVDAARVPILLPQSLYSINSRDFLLAQTGAELYGRVRTRSLGALEYRIYGGTIFLDIASQTTVSAQVTNLDVPYVAGQRLMWETPIEGLRAGASLQALRLDADVRLPDRPPVSLGIPAVLWVGSAEYALHDLLLSAEYSRWVARLESNDAVVAPPMRAVSERAYAMASYRINEWFQPGAYYSLYYPDVKRRSGREAMQHDVAATLRFDINHNWLVKLEGHFMSGTAMLSADLNNGRSPAQLDRNWGVFLVKTTAHF